MPCYRLINLSPKLGVSFATDIHERNANQVLVLTQGREKSISHKKYDIVSHLHAFIHKKKMAINIASYTMNSTTLQKNRTKHLRNQIMA